MGRGDGDPTLQFAFLVREYRREAGLTQRELAAKAGLSVAALRDIEQARRCRPRANSLAALASALNLDPDQAATLGRAALTRRRQGPGLSLADAHSAWATRTYEREAGLWLAALGPLEAWADGTPLPLGPPARRAVLGLLLIDPGVLVRRDTIVDVLWGDSPPRTATGLVQAHVSRIRKVLSEHNDRQASDVAIDSAGGAYRLAVSGQEVDLLVFRELAGQAAMARAAGDDVTAAECYAQAVGLWRGDPFADVDALRGHPGIIALRQELTGVLLRYAEVACALGQHHQVLPRLRALADAEPFNEPAHAQLMIALARSGQRAAALRVYQDVRTRLDRELGIYPGEELAETYVRVLRQDVLAWNGERTRARPAALSAAGRVVPRQLRAGRRSFVGRARELAALSALADSAGSDPRQTSGVTMAALTGMAGIGKTALAVYWAHHVADRFPDGQLFVNLRGSGPSGRPLTPTEAVRGFLTGLGVPPMRIPADTEGQAALYRSLLAGRRMLIVLDNAENAEQIRPLLPGSPSCLVLITSRNRLTGLAAAEGAHLISLGVLTDAESRELLASNLDAGQVMAESAAISELIALCGHLPLALCGVAARAAAGPGLPLTALAAEMRNTRGRLNALETGEAVTSVRTVFSWSRAKLGSLAARVFRLLAVHPGPDITVPAVASLAALSLADAYPAVAELCEEHLLTEYVPGRYTCHDLLRSYAAEEAGTGETEASLRQAVQRTLDHYLHAAIVASRFIYPGQAEIIWTPAQPGVTVEKIAGPGQAAEWFANEQQVLLGVISQAAEGGYAPYAWKLPWIAGRYLRGEACWHRLAAALETALVVAKRLNDLAGLVLARQQLGWLRFLLGDIVSADHQLNEAMELAGRLGDRRLQALVGLSLACVLQAQDRVFEATVQARQVLRLYKAVGDVGGEARARYAIGYDPSCSATTGKRRN